MAMQVESDLVTRIKAAQVADSEIQEMRDQLAAGGRAGFFVSPDGTMRYGSRLVVPDGAIRDELLREAHSSAYAVHPGSTKMYHDLKEHYWWSGMKRDVADFVSRCLVCQ